jgi:hypothetical protein
MRLLPRRTLSAALLLAFVIGASFFVPRGQITQTNIHRIQEGMTKEEVIAMLGQPRPLELGLIQMNGFSVRCWESSRNEIHVYFLDGKVLSKEIYFRTAWETLRWHAKKGAEQIGVKWN